MNKVFHYKKYIPIYICSKRDIINGFSFQLFCIQYVVAYIHRLYTYALVNDEKQYPKLNTNVM